MSSFSLLVLWIYQPTSFWCLKFLMRNLLIIFFFENHLYVMSYFSLISKFPFLSFDSFDVGLWFIPLGVYWASCMLIFMYFINFGEFPALISTNILSVPFSLSSFCGTHNSCRSTWWIPQVLGSIHFSSKIFSFCFLDAIIFIVLYSKWLILLAAQIYLSVLAT